MFIQTEDTPNPNSLKFLFDQEIYQGSDSFDYTIEASQDEAFSKSIFEIPGIDRLYICGTFLTITKAEHETWSVIKPQVLQLIMHYSVNKQPMVKLQDLSKPQQTDEKTLEHFSDIEKEIYELIEERVRPAVAMDGGDVALIKYDTDSGIVYLRMKGSCSGCPSSSATLKGGVKRMLQHYIPEIVDVCEESEMAQF